MITIDGNGRLRRLNENENGLEDDQMRFNSIKAENECIAQL